jgi:hypothetical protein
MSMKLLVLYRPNSEFARKVEAFIRDLQTMHNVDERHVQVLDFDSREGSATASLYDVMSQPALLVIGDDGGYVKDWQGPDLPLLSEVAGYVVQYQ